VSWLIINHFEEHFDISLVHSGLHAEFPAWKWLNVLECAECILSVSVQSLLLFAVRACIVFLLTAGLKFTVTKTKLHVAAVNCFSRRTMSSTKRKFCEHCQEFVSARTYRQHLDLYHNKETGQWNIREECSDEEKSDPVDLDVC